MNTLKSLMVIAVLGIIGYGVYVVLNNNPAPPTPDWVKAETMPTNMPPSVQPGAAVSPGEVIPPIDAPSNYRPPTAAISGGDAPGYSPANGAPPAYGAPSGGPAAYGQSGYGVSNGSPTAYGAPSGPTAGYAAPGASPTNYGPSSEPTASPAVPLRYRDVVTPAPPTAGGGSPGSAGNSRGAADARLAAVNASYQQSGDGLTGNASGAAAASRSATIPENLRNPAPRVDGALGQSGGFEAVMAAAHGQLDRGQLDMALLTLSNLYDNPRLSQQQQVQLNELLDQVAGTVFYSRKSLIEPPHRVLPGEQLLDIANKYHVPPGLLAKINGLGNPPQLATGQELKVIRGPFFAIVNVQTQTLAVMVGNRYAGRFPISLSPDLAQMEGQFVVASKTQSHVRYHGQPYIELSPAAPGARGQAPLAIVGGMTDPDTIERERGLIGLTPKNADDLYDMLTEGSKVVIHR